MLESTIQSGIRKKLMKQGWTVKKIGTEGWPDYLAVKKPLQIKFIEVKQPGKIPDPLQKYIHQKLRKMGFEVIVATNSKQL